MHGTAPREYELPQHTFDTSLTVLLFGVMLEAVSFGNLTTLLWEYRNRCQADARLVRLTIVTAWVLCAFSLGINVHAMCYYLNASFMKPGGPTAAPWSVCIVMVINEAVAVLVRFTFLYRVYRLSRARDELGFLAIASLVFIALLSLVGFVGAVFISIHLFSNTNSQIVTHTKATYIAVFAAGVVADVILTTLLCLCLRRSRTGTARMHSVLKLLILYSINTGLFPSVIATAGIIAFLVSPNSFFFHAFYIQLSNLLLISLVSSLNHRASVRRQIERPLTVDFGPLNALAPSDIEFEPVRARPGSHSTLGSPTATDTDADTEKCGQPAFDGAPPRVDSVRVGSLDLADWPKVRAALWGEDGALP